MAYTFLRPYRAKIVHEYLRANGIDHLVLKQMLATAVERAYLKQGRIAYATVTQSQDNEENFDIQVYAINSGKAYEVFVPLVPSAEALVEMLESHLQQFRNQFAWWVCIGQVERADELGILLSLNNPESPLHGEYATMEWNRLAEMDDPSSIRPGTQLLVAAYRPHGMNTPAATRVDSIFLRMVVRRYFDLDVRAEIAAGVGLIMLSKPQFDKMATFIGPNGEMVKRLAAMVGLRRIIVIRQPTQKSMQKRIEATVKAITGVRKIRVLAPSADGEPWTVVTRPEHLGKLIGQKGANAVLIKRVVDSPIHCLARSQIR